MLPEKAVQSFLLANRELSGLNAGVIDAKQRVNVVHRLCTDVCQFLDLGGSILDLGMQT